MVILDFSHSKKQAFTNGFMKSIASPAALFMRREIQPIEPVKFISYQNVQDADALKGDWLKIGQDLKMVMERYEPTSA